MSSPAASAAMERLAESPLFEPMQTADGSATVYVLTRRVAPLQQSFYFVNDAWSRDARWLWFYCAHPPASGKTLGVIDFERQTIHHYPETQFDSGGASPFIEPETGVAYWSSGRTIWRRSPKPDDPPEPVNELPADFIGGRQFNRLATHLTRSADGRAFFVDSQFGLQWWLGALPLDGGDYEPWHRLDRNYNHAQFSPTDPALALFAQEGHPDPITGLQYPIEDRMWLIRRGQPPRPVFPTPTRCTHEWWDPDGEHVWCIWHPDPQNHGTYRVNIHTGEAECRWPRQNAWHSHTHATGLYLVGDQHIGAFGRGVGSTVEFYNTRTGRTVRLMDNPERRDRVGRGYHIDPHPRFGGDERFINFTTTIRGEVDLAVTPVEPLVERTS